MTISILLGIILLLFIIAFLFGIGMFVYKRECSDLYDYVKYLENYINEQDYNSVKEK